MKNADVCNGWHNGNKAGVSEALYYARTATQFDLFWTLFLDIHGPGRSTDFQSNEYIWWIKNASIQYNREVYLIKTNECAFTW